MTTALTGAPEVELERVACLLCGSTDSAAPVARGRDYEYESSALEFQFVACACGHVYMDPRPTLRAAPIIYPKNYYAFTGAHRKVSLMGRLKDFVVSRRVRPLVAGLAAGAHLMEAGCGDGSLLVAIRKLRPDLKLTGVDIQFSPATRALLTENRIEVLEVALEEVKLSHELDMVVMNQLIEHLWEGRRCLANLNAALRPGGILSISTPNLGGYDRAIFRTGTWGGYHIPRHLNLFTKQSATRFLGTLGFEPVRIIDLAAPLIWIASFHNSLKARGNPLARLFFDSNLAFLAMATVTDLVMRALGFETSNQQIIARKVRDLDRDQT